MNKKKLPNFLVVGAAKCGTTAIDGYLKQHPEIFLPYIKECRYFSNVRMNNKNPFTKRPHVDFVDTPEDYYSLYENTSRKVAGDISPDYLYYHNESINRIKEELGDETKILIFLRNPVQRAFSNYLHIIREGYDGFSFEQFIDEEKKWQQDGTYYGFHVTFPGFYYEAVKNYKSNFKNIKVIVFEEFIRDVKAQLKDICDFLEIDNTFEFQEPAFKNKTGLPKYQWVDFLVKNKSPFKKGVKKMIALVVGEKVLRDKLYKIKESNLEKPELNEESKAYLENLYKIDIEALGLLLEKDLCHWKK